LEVAEISVEDAVVVVVENCVMGVVVASDFLGCLDCLVVASDFPDSHDLNWVANDDLVGHHVDHFLEDGENYENSSVLVETTDDTGVVLDDVVLVDAALDCGDAFFALVLVPLIPIVLFLLYLVGSRVHSYSQGHAHKILYSCFHNLLDDFDHVYLLPYWQLYHLHD
jgi:hypothetical protein